MENSNSTTRIYRFLPAWMGRSAVAAVKNLQAVKGNRITLFGYLLLAASALLGTFTSRLLLL